MSTEYYIYAKDDVSISLDEHSCKLDLCTIIKGVVTVDIKDLTPEEVTTMACKMIQAAWYQDEDAVKKAVAVSRTRYTVGLHI